MRLAGGACTARAPGKLVIAGVYAVLTPGHPAVVASAGRYVTVTASVPAGEGEGEVQLVTDLLPHSVPLRRTRTGVRPVHDRDQENLRGPLAHLAAAVDLVDRLRAELGVPPMPIRLETHSALHEGGTKMGLGSSGAVTVAAVDALTSCWGMEMSTESRFRLSLLAGAEADPEASGADIAAGVWHGWIRYSPPDRHALCDSLARHGVLPTLRARWPGLSVRAVPPPSALALLVGWTGSPVSTAHKVGLLHGRDWWQSPARHRFLADSDEMIADMCAALEQDDPEAMLGTVRRARVLLETLDQECALGIFTDSLSSLCRIAGQYGAAAKPSGAGGGDCGIALLPPTERVHLLRHSWSLAGITPLRLPVAPVPTGRAKPPREIGPLAAEPYDPSRPPSVRT